MIVTLLKGGLGNQMFQYAAGRCLALKHNTQLYLDLSWFDSAKDLDTARSYELNCFNLQQKFIKHSGFVLADDEPTIKTKVYNSTKGLFKPRLNAYTEKSAGFDRQVLSLPDKTYLDGYWQNENYFKDTRATILKDFSFRTEASGKNAEFLAQIRTSQAISLHVRRGDYAANKSTNAFHGLLGLEYYQSAANLIAKKVKSPHFFVFSDDPAWCKKNLKLGFAITYVSHNKAGFEDLRLMAACKHNIIANSSFSWWGAWLGQNTDKIVVAPKIWFADKKANSQMDNIPKKWIKL